MHISRQFNLKPRFLKPIAFVIVFNLITISVLAQDTKALTVSPVRLEVAGDPGQSVTKTIKLTNEQAETNTFYVSFENFTAQGETNKPEFLGSEEDLATWIVAPAQVSLEPGHEIKIPVTIEIPSDADPGDHFAAIFWGTTPPDPEKGGQVAIGGRLGVLVLLRVTGEISEQGSVVEFSGKDNQSVFDALPVELIYRIQNTGNVRVQPKGSINITGPLGREVARLSANPTESNALPDTTRMFEVTWEKTPSSDPVQEPQTEFWGKVRAQTANFRFGRYSAHLDATFGESNRPLQTTFSFWIIPWQLLSLVGSGCILVLVMIGVSIRAYTRRAIRKALEQHAR